jgi:hypothetical protein
METFIELTAGSLVYMTPQLCNGGTLTRPSWLSLANVRVTVYHAELPPTYQKNLGPPFYLEQEEQFHIEKFFYGIDNNLLYFRTGLYYMQTIAECKM